MILYPWHYWQGVGVMMGEPMGRQDCLFYEFCVDDSADWRINWLECFEMGLSVRHLVARDQRRLGPVAHIKRFIGTIKMRAYRIVGNAKFLGDLLIGHALC